jgi:thioredoxin 1
MLSRQTSPPGSRDAAARAIVIAVVLIASHFLLSGCGEAGPGATVDSTVASSASTSPPETTSPIAASGLPKVVDFGSLTCTPCKLMAVELDELAQEYARAVDVVFVDVYENEALASEMRIRIMPTQIFFDPQGNELFRHDGFLSKEDMVSRFQWLGFSLAPADISPGQETGSSDGGG